MNNEQLNEINLTHSLIIKANGIKRAFNKQSKIKFAYDYWNLNDDDITELYIRLAEEKNEQNYDLAKIIGIFMDLQKITNIKKFTASFYEKDIETIQNSLAKVRENGNWLSKYNVEKEFSATAKNINPIFYSYIRKDQSIFKIDRNAADSILGILIEENIPTAKCIVQASFPYYANDNMDTFVKQLRK